jgi:hypothetical protein
MNNKISPQAILQGIFDLDRATLSIFLALFEDSKATSLVSDKIMDVKGQYQTWSNKELETPKDHFSQRIEKTSQSILNDEASDDMLRSALWEHLLHAYNLDDGVAISPRSAQIVSNDLAASVTQVISKQKEKEDLKPLDKINPFSSQSSADLSFEEAVQYILNKLIVSALKENEVTEKEVISALKTELSKLDESILKEAGINNLTDQSIRKVLTTSGGLLGLMGAVQFAGFSAYIFAAQASAIIPIVGGKTLVSLLFVLSNPLFVVPAILTAGVITNNNLTKSIKKAFGAVVISLLAIRGAQTERGLHEVFQTFMKHDALLKGAQEYKLLSDINISTKIRKITETKENIIFPDMTGISKETQGFLDSEVIPTSDKSDLIHSIIYPTADVKEVAALAGVTFADFLYDLAAIDPLVIEAADFARKADLSTPFNFAQFTESLEGLSIASMRGHQANLMGYTAERIVASKLIEKGHLVSIPDSATQPGFDLNVDGAEFQVKCIKPENFHILEKHFNKYPDTPVFANAEMASVISEKSPEWADQVFFVEGYTHELADRLVTKAIDAGQELDDFEILSSIAIISTAKNIHSWWKGQQSFQTSAFNVLLDSASKGTMAIVGGFVGGGIGMLMFGPAGAYIVGGTATVFGATKGRFIKDGVDAVLAPDREIKLKALADELLEICNEHLEAKKLGIDSKILSTPDSELGRYIAFRMEWEKVFVQAAINRNDAFISNKKLNGNKKVARSLKIASESGIHPVWLQDQYKKIAAALNEKVDRVDRFKSKLLSMIRK